MSTSMDLFEAQPEFALTAPAIEPKKPKKEKPTVNIHMENLSIAALMYPVRKTKKPGQGRVKKDRSLRAIFRSKLAELDIERLKKPWMATKSFQNLTTAEALKDYVDHVLADKSAWMQPYLPDAEGNGGSEFMPVIAVDTETYGLDTRVMVDFELVKDYASGKEICIPIYEVNIEIAGVCLSHDGKKGVYIPIFHEDGNNVPIDVVRDELQRLFDVSHLVFYNAKFDREVMRQTLAIKFRDYPHYEDVQVLQFAVDPKADLDDDTFTGGGEGLKGLSKTKLGMEQIELSEIGKVQAEVELTAEELEEERLRPRWTKLKKRDGLKLCATCAEQAAFLRVQIVKGDDGETVVDRYECAKPGCFTKVKYKPRSRRMQYVPFTWIPTEIALWYAASDAICTWLLWEGKVEQERKAAFRIKDGTQCEFHMDGPKVCSRLKGHAGPCQRAMGLREEAQSRKLVHRIDGNLIDSLTWIERQRFIVDTAAHARLNKWHAKASVERKERLREIANRHGWEQFTTDDGDVIEDSIFNVDSTAADLPKLLFTIKGLTPTKDTETGKPSCDAESISDLLKQHPHDEFLLALTDYKEYVSLHPEKLSWDPRDKSARIYLKQATTAGGRLAASGGKFYRDGGLSMNIQAIKSVGGNWWVKGDVLVPDFVEEHDVEAHEEHELDPSVFQEAKKDEIMDAAGQVLTPEHPAYAQSAETMGFQLRDGKWTRKAPGILKNHIANFLGYSICLVPKCTTCARTHGILIGKSKLDANQIINLRALFIAEDGWTFVTSDYSNIEMRVAANISKEPEFIREFLEGSGDFHTLTASKVFAEFNDPNTSKARKKELRSLAKIINFALLYGGTMYTIYENMKKTDPKITMKDTKIMVENYWKGVPVFEQWCQHMQKIARDLMTCTTATNRIVKFESAMDSLGIYKPTPGQMDNYFVWIRLRKKFRELEEAAKARLTTDEETPQEEKDQAAGIKEHMDKLWNDRESGVRNASDYNRFMSKIQRVSVNVPLQGLAGEFMRMTLNRVRHWATTGEYLVQSVMRLHGSVHDELDYAVKNPYVPFVVPRMTRLMKLRKMHANRGWIVPIEADTEYGRSWDVSFHLTGDDGHKPSGWTDIKGLEDYVPDEFAPEAVDRLIRAILSEKEAARTKADAFLKENLHERAYTAVWHAFWSEDKNKVKSRVTNEAVVRKQLIAALQLHEYWMIDDVPDGEDETMETMEQYEARRGLTAADRGYMPEGGWLHTVPLDRVRRKPLPILGEAPPPPVEVEPLVTQVDEVGQERMFYDEIPEPEPEPEVVVVAAAPVEPRVVVNASTPMAAPLPQPEADYDEMLMPAPKKRNPAPASVPETPVVAVTPIVPPPPKGVLRKVTRNGMPVLRNFTSKEDGARLAELLGKGMGEKSIQVISYDKVKTLSGLAFTEIPAEYLAEEMVYG